MLAKLFVSVLLLGVIFVPLGYASDVCNGKKIMEYELLGKQVNLLFENYGFIKIEKDTEYADLKKNEQYWLAINSHYEYLTLHTIEGEVVEVIIHNPDLYTKQGVKVGDSLYTFKTKYPNSIELTHYKNGVQRHLKAYWIDAENIEVEFYKDKISVLRLIK